jgi:hypothetical protein
MDNYPNMQKPVVLNVNKGVFITLINKPERRYGFIPLFTLKFLSCDEQQRLK